MPLIYVDTWPGISSGIKSKWIYKATQITSEFLNIPPDKIQVLIRELPQENWGKAGAVPTDCDFAEKSRIINWQTKESYDDGKSLVSNMVVVTIDAWNICNQEQKDEWTKLLTFLTVDLLEAPLDKVLVLIRDMPPGNWSQAGITGANSEYLNLSRQIAISSAE